MRLLLDKPNLFFKKTKERFRYDAAYIAIFAGMFSLLNEAVVRAGLTNFVPTVGSVESFIINYIALLTGFLILAFVFSVMHLDKGILNGFRKSFFVLAYTTTPVFVIGWIPFAVMKAIAMIWSLFFMVIGISVVMKQDYRRSVFETFLIVAVVYGMILLSRNELLSVVPIYG